jgi:hypothetical protein
MLFLSSPLVLWAPSASYIDEEFKKGNSQGKVLLNSQNILELVKREDIRIIGREEYLTKPSSREGHRWRHAKWVKEFDDVIADLALADRQKGLAARRVILAPPETGREWAKQQRRRTTRAYKAALELVQKDELPLGTRERIEDLPTLEDKAETALRDAADHQEACELSRCILPIEPDQYAVSLSLLTNRRHSREKLAASEPSMRLPDSRRVVELIKLLSSLSAPKNFDQVQKSLDLADRNALRDELDILMEATADPRITLKREISGGYEDMSWLKVALPRRRDLQFVLMASMLLRVVTTSLTPLAGMAFLLGLYSSLRGIAERASLIPYSGYRGRMKEIFMVAYGTRDPKYYQIKEILDRLS